MKPEKVVLLIADISGYTQFMLSHQKALAHSQMIISELLNLLVEQVEPPLELVELEGDAVFMHVVKEDSTESWGAIKREIGEQLLRFFKVFGEKVGELGAYSVCLCNACTNIDKLKLKIIVHSGEVLFYKIGNFNRLSGVDVITVHRLLKNSVEADEYMLMTESAYSDIEFPQQIEVVEGEEAYDVGTIKTYTFFPPASTKYTKDAAVQLFSASSVGLEILRHEVRQEYTEVVATTPEKGFHFHTGRPLATLLGYDNAWVDALPASAVESFAGTGNPFSLGEIQSGERVVDVGSGAGFDSLIAAQFVGPTGRVVGVEMTPAMLQNARNAAAEAGLNQVEFKEGYAESLPLPDCWADVIISNGAVNLCPEKSIVFGEMYRVLKPGGRLQIGDIMVQRAVPEEAKKDIDLWTG